jgi:hypothetical protein
MRTDSENLVDSIIVLQGIRVMNAGGDLPNDLREMGLSRVASTALALVTFLADQKANAAGDGTTVDSVLAGVEQHFRYMLTDLP